jgi:hypothetical protein
LAPNALVIQPFSLPPNPIVYTFYTYHTVWHICRCFWLNKTSIIDSVCGKITILLLALSFNRFTAVAKPIQYPYHLVRHYRTWCSLLAHWWAFLS